MLYCHLGGHTLFPAHDALTASCEIIRAIDGNSLQHCTIHYLDNFRGMSEIIILF